MKLLDDHLCLFPQDLGNLSSLSYALELFKSGIICSLKVAQTRSPIKPLGSNLLLGNWFLTTYSIPSKEFNLKQFWLFMYLSNILEEYFYIQGYMFSDFFNILYNIIIFFIFLWFMVTFLLLIFGWYFSIYVYLGQTCLFVVFFQITRSEFYLCASLSFILFFTDSHFPPVHNL